MGVSTYLKDGQIKIVRDGTARHPSNITRLWRKYVGVGRLYWRLSNLHWCNWDRGEVARARSGTASYHYYSIDALLDEIERNLPKDIVPGKRI